jgi:hypothetical protein
MMTESTLLTMEASRVIALRMQVFMLGGAGALQEADLMVKEKTTAFKRRWSIYPMAFHSRAYGRI